MKPRHAMKIACHPLPMPPQLEAGVRAVLDESFPGLPESEIQSRFRGYDYVVLCRRGEAVVGVLFMSRKESGNRILWGFRMTGMRAAWRSRGLSTRMSRKAFWSLVVPDLLEAGRERELVGFARVCSPIAARIACGGQRFEPDFVHGRAPTAWARDVYQDIKAAHDIPALDPATGLCLDAAREHGIHPAAAAKAETEDARFFRQWRQSVPEGSELVMVFPLSWRTVWDYVTTNAKKIMQRKLSAVPRVAGVLGALLVTIVCSLLMVCASVVSARLARTLVRSWGWACLRLMRIRVEVEHGERLTGAAAVYAAQHTSLLDTFVYPALLPVDTLYIAKSELARLPLLSFAYRRLGYLFVDRSGGASALLSLERAASEAAPGHSFFVHPQGTRRADGEIGPLKSGVVALAKAAALPIVPISSAGGDALWPRGRLAPRPGTIRITIQPAVTRDEVQGLERRELLEKLRAALSQ
jgi:1-acyl-sn-glycerol-3-phosphate acyltransferase